ncbi:39S ribosomal protein L43, mitochondrial [Phytophthora boehmeriae]|uniref:39S ribosomal protein L43, mitochondrial n=1 Tax=Phytophthora boehmeriae TaxID=109152 RepID=A0A8T1XEN6_9STRA|nr:39S ribosomal protein L43, mitochondrial [Phytophthora boehmeriae]
MATKGVWQLKQVTIRYCQHGGSSRYVRQLLTDERFLNFVKENPQVQFETELKGARHPILIGDYITDERKVTDVKNQDIPFIMKQLERLRNTSGRKMTHMKKPIISKRPTIQGIWQPDLDFPEFKISDRT